MQERFAGESSLTGLYDEPSTTGFGFEAVPSIFDAGDEFTWAHSEVEHQPETYLQLRVLNQQAVEYSNERHGDSTEQSPLSEVAVIDAAMTCRTTTEQVSAASDVITSRSPGKENRFNPHAAIKEITEERYIGLSDHALPAAVTV
ncbi:unnamed protein product [Cylicocyclus nassatus]|uniref:Uncharacterized protein n=1 Tax=Cylicocyclus nassatus TaxID=53992 RepID=A0AA36DTN4_CYLNA|nr:unnamed protein product [Cylicocyclus nassatus]